MAYKNYTITYTGKELKAGLRPIGEKIVRRHTKAEALKDFKTMYKTQIEADWGMRIKVLGAEQV